MTEERKQSESGEDTVVISFRAPRELVAKLDERAKGARRTRANLIVLTLTRAVTLEPGIDKLDQVLRLFHMLLEKHGKDSVEAEFYRGVISGASSMLEAFFGRQAAQSARQQAHQRTGLPIPHGLLLPPGSSYGFDSEADF